MPQNFYTDPDQAAPNSYMPKGSKCLQYRLPFKVNGRNRVKMTKFMFQHDCIIKKSLMMSRLATNI